MPKHLFKKLQSAKTEEDVKDIYIKSLGLKNVQKNLVDIQTKEIWFEAKNGNRNSIYGMFTQLLHYVQVALNKGEEIPPFLAVIDTQKAAIMKTSDVVPFLKLETINWGKRASDYPKEALDAVSLHIGTYFVSFNLETHEDEFITTVKNAIAKGDIIRTQITPDNLKQVFDKWVELIGKEISGVSEDQYALLFFADIMSDGKISTHKDLPAELLHKGDEPVFMMEGNIYELGSPEGYRQFWMIYHRPPAEKYRNYLLERRDSLIPLDERAFKGAFYTPLQVVDKAYELLNKTLGKNWQKNYVVWDMCCGVGNLEVKHSNHRNIYMSTLDEADIDIMKASKTCVAATRFQYDYLNDDISDDGEIDYLLTNKMPQGLRDAIANGKKLLVLINPPYGEAGAGIGRGFENKGSIERTKINDLMGELDLGYARKELFVQFLVRIATEIPNATVGMFSKLKYVNAPNFAKFRDFWSARFLDGFVTHSKAFDGIKGDFPIGFLLWKTSNDRAKHNRITEIAVEVLDKNSVPIGQKSYFNVPNAGLLNSWIAKPRVNDKLALPLSNAVTVSKNPRLKKSCDQMIGYLYASNNDIQHATRETCITSSIFTGGNGGGLYITADNLRDVSVVFSVRRLIKPLWHNDRDQFLQPSVPLSEEFQLDCLIWMLFNGHNLTASADGLEWNEEKWSLVNHFIPFSEQEVGSDDRFESDFMVQYLSKLRLSKEAKTVMKAGQALWKTYFDHTSPHSVREELKLNRPDVGWYQIRQALKRRNASGNHAPVDFSDFERAYIELSDKLRPQVFELGFLKP